MSQSKGNLKNILVVRTDRIGDVILSLPIARIIKEHLPGCKVTFLVREYTFELVKHHPFIDDVLTLKEIDGDVDLKSNITMIKENGFDSAITVYPTFKTSLMIFLSKIPLRIGTGYRWYSMLFNSKVYEHRKDAKKHELEYNVGMLKNIGIDINVTNKNVKFDLNPADEADRFINNLLKEQYISSEEPLIIIHPGSGGSSIDLPVNKYVEIVKNLTEKFSVKILVTGLEKEKFICSQLVLNDNVKNLAGKLTLSQMIALTSRAKLFIANSTGTIHIAAALNIPAIGFYPKIPACSANRWGPYSDKSIVFSPQIDCNKCTREQCGQLDCMNTINTNDVIVSAQKILNLVEKNGD